MDIFEDSFSHAIGAVSSVRDEIDLPEFCTAKLLGEEFDVFSLYSLLLVVRDLFLQQSIDFPKDQFDGGTIAGSHVKDC